MQPADPESTVAAQHVGLHSSFAACGKEPLQTFMVEAYDHQTECNLYGNGLQGGLTADLTAGSSERELSQIISTSRDCLSSSRGTSCLPAPEREI